jgi:ATP-dependent DNA helicase RecG
MILENPQISTAKMGELLGISKRAVLKQTKNLQDQDKLKRIGPARGGHWEIINKKE